MAVSEKTLELLRHLASRPGHDEVKADFRQLLMEEFGADLSSLEFERRVPEVRGRLDALIGRTVFEAKSDLDKEWQDVERRMPDYLADREREEKQHFVGIAADGLKWAVFELNAGHLATVKRTYLSLERVEEFLAWLDGALALKASLPPDALTIRAELGRDSVAYHLAHSNLQKLWEKLKNDPAVALKRQVWEDLLKYVYGREIKSDSLWFQHTFLVIVAKSIALAVLHMREDDPKKLLSGEVFASAGINGAVESDFFDWIVADKEGEGLVRRIMNHVRRFRLEEVESDVLKILYESLIDREERHGLGEYYTPDWLAAKIVRRAVERPLEQRVLDPACGSGTFLFHAIRNFLNEAEDAGTQKDMLAVKATELIAGIDIHPVAVIIARVTYLLALAPALRERQGSLSIPIYLGDSLQLSISEFMTGKELTIKVPPSPAGQNKSGEKDGNGKEQLDFPETFCRDPALFDKAIERIRMGSLEGLTRLQIEKALYRLTEQHYRADVTDEQKCAIQDLGKTYVTFDRLRRENRDTIWSYVARNLSRPLAFSTSGGWAHVLLGNPPWVAFRHMSEDLQKRFKELAKGERVYVNRVPSHNDLCALFVVRTVALYLNSGGRLAFVLPMAALTRGQFEALRKGSFFSARIAWDEVWSMDEFVYPLFPVPSCAVFGRRRAIAKALSENVRAYKGQLPYRDASEEMADEHLQYTEGANVLQRAKSKGGSAYRTRFRQGAILVPRVLCFVEKKISSRLGMDSTTPMVVSRRSPLEKLPWRGVESIEHQVEAEFIRPVLLGESIAPYRIIRAFDAVIPVTSAGWVLTAENAANEGLSALHGWLSKAERVWRQHGKAKRTFAEQLNYINQLSAQFPLAPLRVVYAASGTNPAATIIAKSNAVIEHKLYWTACSGIEEAHFLIAILNSEVARLRTEQYQSRGQFGARDFDKVIFNLPIPTFDAKNRLHFDLAGMAREAEKIVAKVGLPEKMKFQTARKLIRSALAEAKISQKIDDLVKKLLDEK